MIFYVLKIRISKVSLNVYSYISYFTFVTIDEQSNWSIHISRHINILKRFFSEFFKWEKHKSHIVLFNLVCSVKYLLLVWKKMKLRETLWWKAHVRAVSLHGPCNIHKALLPAIVETSLIVLRDDNRICRSRNSRSVLDPFPSLTLLLLSSFRPLLYSTSMPWDCDL